MKERTPALTDNIPENIHKRLHLIYFFFKCLLGAFVFLFIYSTFIHTSINAWLGITDSNQEETRPFLSHMYCGTFFVEMNRDNSFVSDEAYAAAISNVPREHSVPENVLAKISSLLSIIGVISLFIAARSGDKKTLYCRNGWKWGLAGGIAQFLNSAVIAAISYIFTDMLSNYGGLTGIWTQRTWYFQIYRHFLTPFLLICAALVLQRYSNEMNGRSTAANSRALKAVAAVLVGVSAGFILLRAGIRTYELVRVVSGDAYTVKLPFTIMDIGEAYKIPLPYEDAKTPADYIHLIVFRYVRDMSVAAVSAVSVWLFAKVLIRVSAGEINTPANRKRINTIMILLAAASLIFNIMGLFEINMLNSGFSGIYGEVTYTIGFRANCEPLLYAVIVWFFKTYMMSAPEKAAA